MKNCPFCNSTNLSIKRKTFLFFLHDGYYVMCHNCRACGPVRVFKFNAENDWNDRQIVSLSTGDTNNYITGAYIPPLKQTGISDCECVKVDSCEMCKLLMAAGKKPYSKEDDTDVYFY